MWKLWRKFSVILILFSLDNLNGQKVDEPLNYDQVNCGHNYGSDCVIEAIFGNFKANETVDVLIKCSNHDELSYNQFSKIDKVIWNGCGASKNLKKFGLTKIPWKNQVKFLQIENFATSVLDENTFDGFDELESLTIEANYMQNLTACCFDGLRSLKNLKLLHNNLKWIDGRAFSTLMELKTLTIVDDAMLFIGSHQFAENQIHDNVDLKIYGIQLDLMEHLIRHARNVSISMNNRFSEMPYGYDFIGLNGSGKNWIVEDLKISIGSSVGFEIAEIDSLRSLELCGFLGSEPSYKFHLENLRNLEKLKIFGVYKEDIILTGNFSKVHDLEISQSFLSELDLKHFENFTNLKSINLSENSIIRINSLELFNDVQIEVDKTYFDCNWLQTTAANFFNFGYKKSIKGMNYNGLPCLLVCLKSPEITTDSSAVREYFYDEISNYQWKLKQLEENVILRPGILAIIVIAAILLGVSVTLFSLRLYQHRQMLKHQPFYHLLRESILRPITNVGEILKNDIKSLMTRELPPTNYEHPISERPTTELTDIENETANIYEEIPAKN